jgi:hypothetical protein
VSARGVAGTHDTTAGAVRMLGAQTLAFGFTAALVGVVANAMFLDAYGSGWLPATYLAIGAAGIAVSAGIARGSRRWDVVPIAVAVLGAIAAVFLGAWVVARDGGGVWVSGPLLVVFAILIELGFVFVGMQAGRVLDIAGIKATMPRIMAGFPIGAIAGGLVAGPLVSLLGRTEALLVPTFLGQATFTGLVWVTGRRYADRLARPRVVVPRAGGRPPRSRGRLLANRFVLLVLTYQVLSALGSQLADFLVMDRAAARYPQSEDLARYVAGYTAVMNVVIIVFLLTLAGPLVRRFGLRFGIAANPFVVTALAVVMVVVTLGWGAASLGLLLVVSATRIVDLALSDGTTRTSVNALYQVLPAEERVEAQATVEGMGVPLAIAASGVLILLVDLLPSPLLPMILTTVLVCAAWTGAAFVLHRAYRPALVACLRRRPLLDPGARLEASAEDAAAAGRLLLAGDAASVRLGLEVSAAVSGSPAPPRGLAELLDDERPDVRLLALAGLARAGHPVAHADLAGLVGEAARADAPSSRRSAALAASVLEPSQRGSVLAPLTADEDPSVRAAALSGVDGALRDVPATPGLAARAVAGLRDGATASAAASAVRGLGDAVLNLLAGALAERRSTTPAWVARLVAAAGPTPRRDAVLAAHVDHPDPVVGLAVLRALAAPDPAPAPLAATLAALVRADAARAAPVLSLLVALESDPRVPTGAAEDVPSRALLRALRDERTLLRERVAAAVRVRHGEAVDGATRALTTGTGDAGVAMETIELVEEQDVARPATAVLDPRISDHEALQRVLRSLALPAPPGSVPATLRALVEAPVDGGPTPWLRACAVAYAAAVGVARDHDLAVARTVADRALAEQVALLDPAPGGLAHPGPRPLQPD